MTLTDALAVLLFVGCAAGVIVIGLRSERSRHG
jgi:hypothetical protein